MGSPVVEYRSDFKLVVIEFSFLVMVHYGHLNGLLLLQRQGQLFLFRRSCFFALQKIFWFAADHFIGLIARNFGEGFIHPFDPAECIGNDHPALGFGGNQ